MILIIDAHTQELAKLIIVSLFTIAHKKIPFEKLLDYATSFVRNKAIWHS